MTRHKPFKVRGALIGQEKVFDFVVENGVVTAIEPPRGRADAGSRKCLIGPTLFDIQVNGVEGFDLQAPGLKPGDIPAMTERLAKWGVSRWLPTLVTGPVETMRHGCRVIAEALADREVARSVPGIHVEGPHISPLDGPRGAHDRRYVRPPDIRLFDSLLEAARGHIRYTTVAPELEGAVDYIREVVRRGVIVALGHHSATPEQIDRAVDAGARLSTHLGNGMAPMVHRHTNPLWPQLVNDGLAASFIPDLEHLPPQVLKAFTRLKGPRNTILTSDVIHVAGLPPGPYRLGDVPVRLMPGGRVCLEGADLLAGSSLMLLQGVVNAAHATDLSLKQVFACASRRPARVLGVKGPGAMPRVDRKADFVVFALREGTNRRPEVSVKCVFVRGKRCV